jgi:fatty acid desaturase
LGGAAAAAVRGRRPLDAAEARALAAIGAVLMAASFLAWRYPYVIAAPAVVALFWVGLTAAARSVNLLWRRRSEAGRGDADGVASRRAGNP